MNDFSDQLWPLHRLPVPAFRMDTTGRIRRANQRWLSLVGRDAQDVIGKKLVELMTEEARKRCLPIIQDPPDEVRDLQCQCIDGRGKSIDVLLSFSIDRDETGRRTGMLGTMVDVTYWQTTQREAASNAALVASVFAHINDAILITAAEPIDEPGGPQILYVNPAFTAMTGYSADDVLGKTPRILQGPNTSRKELDRLRAALKAWKPVRVELVNYTKAGSEIEIEIDISPVARSDGHFTHWAAIQRDITWRRRQENERLRTIVEGVPDLMWRATAEGCSWTNPQWHKLTGQTLEESLGSGWVQVVDPQDRPRALKVWQRALRTGRLDGEMRLLCKSTGTYRWFRTRATAIRNAHGRIVEWVGTSTDIQDFKEMQKHQSVLLAELQHRTRNLLAVVQAISAKTLRRSTSLQEFSVKYDSRLSALSRMQKLLARTPKNMLDLRQLVELELDAHTGLNPDRVRITGPTIGVGAAAGRTLALALHELATNATKYGALGQDKGFLAIDWAITEDNETCDLSFEWKESGVAMPTDANIDQEGFGREIVEQALPYELGAMTQFQLRPDGVLHRILVPMKRVQDA